MNLKSEQRLQRLEDESAIGGLMQGWLYRDMNDWTQLRGLFHEDGTLSLSWFEGLFTDFVDASIKMGRSHFVSRHAIGAPLIQWNGCRALALTPMSIIGEDDAHDLGFITHGRFVDCVEQRGGEWRIARRDVVYDMSFFTFPAGPVDIDRNRLQHHPREYAALAYVLDQCGFAVQRRYATRGSEEEERIQQEAITWLGSVSGELR
ncbi:hypothetical protein BFW87_00420 [Pseudomonas fluorescens]|uniref:SnoaL-like domain-containing protein n=1 Tax=Pseudomonas fluorescens TaxID=294 RepID=A0A1T2Z8E7_PSEFL|nr:nuclear transport factor 2 family protein [Pseudomonas fluorescens]OPB00912.1 hypothetical protein BFW87_00420 [Pseudomonas fluorescens]